MHATLAGNAGPEGAEHQARPAGHKIEQRLGERNKGLHRSSDGQGDALGPCQRDGFGNNFTKNHVQVGDQYESDNGGDDVRIDIRMGNMHQQRLNHAGDCGFADPAQGQAGEGDAKLYRQQDFVKILMQPLDGARPDAAHLDELLNTRIAHAHKGKFGSHEEGIGCNKEENQEHPQEHERNHQNADCSIPKAAVALIQSVRQ